MATPVALGAGTTNDVLVLSSTSHARLLGWSIRETGGTTGATVVIRCDSASGRQVGAATVAASGTHTQWLGPQGVQCPSGIWVDRPAGTTDVTVWVE